MDKMMQNPDAIDEIAVGKVIMLKFRMISRVKNFDKKMTELVQTVLRRKKEESGKRVALCLENCLDDKWDIVCTTLSEFVDELPNIDILGFQHSDLRAITVFKLYLIYEKYKSMDSLPIISIEDTFADDDSDIITRQFKLEKRGIEFLKKLYFRGNKYYVEYKFPL